jgi:hypothetical protein
VTTTNETRTRAHTNETTRVETGKLETGKPMKSGRTDTERTEGTDPITERVLSPNGERELRKGGFM